MALVTKNIGWAKETTWGTLVAPSAYPRVKTFGLNHDMNTKLVEDTTNTIKGYTKTVNLKKSVMGDIAFHAYADDMGYWLQMVLGAATSVLHASETLVRDHTFAQGAAAQSFTLVADKGVQNDTFLGVYGNSIKLNATNDIVEGTVNAHAKDKGTTSAYTPAVTEIDPFDFSQMNVGFGTNIAAAISATALPVDEWEFFYSNELDTRFQSGARTVSRIDPKIAKATGTFKQFYLANTWESQYTAGTEQAVYFNLKNIDVTIGTSANYQLAVKFPRVQLHKSERPYEAGHLIVEQTEFIAMYDTVATYMVQAILTNLATSYS